MNFPLLKWIEPRKPYRLGLALSGGGAKGLAYVGVFKFLEERGIRPDVIVGTSAGAIAAVLWADGHTSDEIREMFAGREFSEFARVQVPTTGLFDSRGVSEFLKRNLRAKTFEELRIPTIVMATDLDNGRGHRFNSGPIVEAVRASCSIPIIFSPVVIDGVHYVDGGLFHNFPVSIIRDSCEMVIGVNVNPYTARKYSKNIYSIGERSFHYMFRANTVEDRRLCDLLIETEEFGHYKLFDLKNIDHIARVGYVTAVRAYNRLARTADKNNKLLRAYPPPKRTAPKAAPTKQVAGEVPHPRQRP